MHTLANRNLLGRQNYHFELSTRHCMIFQILYTRNYFKSNEFKCAELGILRSNCRCRYSFSKLCGILYTLEFKYVHEMVLSSVSCSAQKSAWLESLQQQLEQQEVYISGDMRRILLMMLSSVYLLQDTVTQLSTLEALRKFVKRFPNLVRTYRCFIADVD